MTHSHHRVLFICRRADYHYGHRHPRSTTGLRTSASMCSRTLVVHGIESKLVIVNDNNDIDREIRRYRPTHVIIEALWVVPDKFRVLIKLYPHVEWIIRIHSELPFMAHESVAVEWLMAYVRYPKLQISGNSERMCADIETITGWPAIYLPNCYIFDPMHSPAQEQVYHRSTLRIGCMGAVRAMKNQLTQAVAAIDFADRLGRRLEFHLNGDRIEAGGNPVLRNIQHLFARRQEHTLHLHRWMEHEDLLQFLTTLDLGMQVSFSESFNHMAADYVRAGLPMVVSPEIRWANRGFRVSPVSTVEMVEGLRRARDYGKSGVAMNARGLLRHATRAERVWVKNFA